MHYMLFYQFVDGFLEKRAPFRAAHLDHIRKAYGDGKLVMAGAFSDPADSSALVFRGDSSVVAESFAKADPYVINGLVTSWRVRAWQTVVGDGLTPP